MDNLAFDMFLKQRIMLIIILLQNMAYGLIS